MKDKVVINLTNQMVLDDLIKRIQKEENINKLEKLIELYLKVIREDKKEGKIK